jgi:hypothetical protein
VLCTASASCGTPAESSTSVAEQPDPPAVVEVDYGVNGCPDFYAFTLEPPDMGLQTPSFVAVFANDPEGDEIFYSFSTTAGRFSETHVNTTTYHCLEVGPQVISVLAIDARGCSKVLNIRVTCSED